MDKHLEAQYLLMNPSQHPTQDCKSYLKFIITVAMFSAYEYSDTTLIEIPGGGIVLPQGANIRFNDLAPGGRVPMVHFLYFPYH
jgi:hypothetical protein